MKKSALLAVSALSLGVVGLATFTPIVNAATTASGDATVTVMVGSAIGIGGETVEPGGNKDDVDMTEYNVDFGEVTAGNLSDSIIQKTIVTTNNTGKEGKLNLKANGEAALKNGDASIPADADVAAGNSAWAYTLTNADDEGLSYGNATGWTAVTAGGVDIATDSDGNGTMETPIAFGLSTANDQATGHYEGHITYTFTVDVDAA